MIVTQAVILCGGRGERLRPLTDRLPKPMVEVNGKPFLFYLLQQLAENGVRSFVLLTGYLGDSIQDYFGDGSKWGWSIRYSAGPVDWQTASRILHAIDNLEKYFFLLYSDNFSQFRPDKLIAMSLKNSSVVTLTVAEKSPGNIKIDREGVIENYDESRGQRDFDLVEIGYSLVNRDRIRPYLETYKAKSFSRVIHALSNDGGVSGISTKTGYKSISDPVRLRETEEHLRAKRILLLDRDGTLNVKSARGEYVNSWDDFKWIEESRNALKRLSEKGFRFIIITNQAGVAVGKTRSVDLADVHRRLRQDLTEDGIDLLDIYSCPEHWNSESEFRKPNPGMFFRASREHDFRLDRVMYVGDDLRDGIAANNAGCRFALVSYSKTQEQLDKSVDIIGGTLLDLVPTILKYYESWDEGMQ